MNPSLKVLVLALDAASPVLLERWMRDGTMPNLARLAATGATVPTRSVDGLYVGATWPSFYTGQDPAGHGIYWTDRIVPGTYRTQRCTPADLGRHPALWELLSGAGRRVVVLDVPLTRLSPGLNGVQLVEWGVHDQLFGLRARPARFGRELIRRFGEYPAPVACDAPHRTLDEYRAFAKALTEGAAARGRLTNHVLADAPWDFAMQVFAETHCAGHQLWHFHDPAHPAHDQAVAEVGDLVRDVYAAVDRAIGSIVEARDDRTVVVVLDLHGMGHSCGGSLLLDDILERLGVMEGAGDPAGAAPEPEAPAAADPASAAAPAAGGPGGLRAVAARAYRLLPEGVREPIYRARQELNQALRRGTPLPIDPARTRAFTVGMGTGAPFTGIRLNLRGREPAGTVSPGAEAEALCESLAADLLEVTEPDSGQPLVRRVVRTAELFTGESADVLPDLLVEWNTDVRRGTRIAGSGAGAVWRAASPKIGTVERLNEYCRTGEHRVEGLCIAAGPGIAAGRAGRVVSNLDLAPTIAALLGVATPNMPGRAVPELLPERVPAR